MPAFGELSAADRELALLEAVFTHAPVGLAYWDGALRYRRINEALAAINGRPVEEHLGRTPSELLGSLGAEAERHMGAVLESGRPVLDRSVRGDPAGGAVDRHFVASYYPVVEAGGAVIGVAAAVTEVTAQQTAEAERVDLLKSALAARALAEAAQIRSELAQDDAEAARARTELLVEAEARMSASMDYATTLEAVARAVVAAVADWCVIALAETPRGEFRSVAVAHVDPVRQAQLRAATDDSEQRAMLEALGLEHALVVPLRTADREMGSLTLSLSDAHRRFAAEAVGLAETIASRAALHIRNAQLYTERSHIAHTLQASLLPHALPDVPHVEVAARYQAAGDQNEVGGDFYDVYPGEDGSWWALIGDVTGKGPEAAALTSLARHTLRSSAAHDTSPAANLRMLNRAMLADTRSTRFATVVCARILPAEGRARVTLAVGGHPPPLVLHADGRLEAVDVRGTLVGALPAPSFADVEVELEAGDLLLLYTDGVIELRTPDPGYGERRLRETVADQAGRPVEEVLEAVLASAVDVRGRRPRDDIALLGLRVCPAA